MDLSDARAHSTFVSCKICTRMILITYANSDMSYEITTHWLGLSRCANDKYQFSYVLTDCKRCKKEEDLGFGLPYPSISADAVEGSPYHYACSLVERRGLELMPSVTHSGMMLFLNIQKLLSYFPQEHQIRGVRPKSRNESLQDSDEFSHLVDSVCPGTGREI